MAESVSDAPKASDEDMELAETVVSLGDVGDGDVGDAVGDGDSDDDFKDEVELLDEKKGTLKKRVLVPHPVAQSMLDTLEQKGDADKIYSCSACNKTFSSKAGAKFHAKHHHTEGRLFCLKCRKPFKFSKDLDRHMNTHKGLRPYDCNECEKSFVCKSSLMQHVKFQHIVGKILKCPVCDKSFCTETDLKRHLRIHTGNKPFTCEQCKKGFVCKSSLNVHKRTHEGKKFKCPQCTMQFYIKSDLERHATKHSGKKPWTCGMCDKSYSCKSTLKVHEKNVHFLNMQVDRIKKVQMHMNQLSNLANTGHPLQSKNKASARDKPPKMLSPDHVKRSDAEPLNVKESQTDAVDHVKTKHYYVKTSDGEHIDIVCNDPAVMNDLRHNKEITLICVDGIMANTAKSSISDRANSPKSAKLLQSEPSLAAEDQHKCIDRLKKETVKETTGPALAVTCDKSKSTSSKKVTVASKKEVSDECIVVPN